MGLRPVVSGVPPETGETRAPAFTKRNFVLWALDGIRRDAEFHPRDAGATSFSDALVSLGFDQRDEPLEFLLADEARDGLADFFKAGKIPEVRKIAALLRLDGLHRAIAAFQKNATASRFFLQGQSAAIPAQPRELLDEIGFAHALERGEAGDFRVRQTHLPRPLAAGRAALAFKENRHARRVSLRQPFVNHRDGRFVAALFRVGAGDVRRRNHGEVFFRREPYDDIPHRVRAVVP